MERSGFAKDVLPILSGGAFAQNDARLQFDVASIKPAAPDQHGTYIRNTPDGRLNIGMPLKEMIVLVWRLDSEGSPKPDEKLQMLQGLLADRFQLPVYALVVARKRAVVRSPIRTHPRDALAAAWGWALERSSLVSRLLQRTAVDKTGLTANFDVSME
jgi:Protein of unknown function (DUF3738)